MDKEFLYRFFDGRATVEEEKQLLDWLDRDPAHRQQLLAERRLYDSMLMLAETKPRKIRRTFTLPRWTREAVKYAAVVLVAAFLGGGYVSRIYERYLLAGNTITVPAGQRVDVVLPDGTKVCMNALSELKYPGFFVGKYRRVQLRGEAFFDVTHDSDRPFVVETYACNVEVLGTKFDVEAHPEWDEFTTSLVEGRVRVTDRENSVQKVELTPTQRVSRRNGQLVVDRIPSHEQFQWREGLIAFRDASFTELIGEFEKYFGVKIEIRCRQTPTNLFTGKIRMAEGIDHALWVLQQSADFTYWRNETKERIFIE